MRGANRAGWPRRCRYAAFVRTRDLAAVVAVVACFSGCGNGSESSTVPSASTSAAASSAEVDTSPTASFPAGMTAPGTMLQVGEWATYAEDQDDPVDVARIRVTSVGPIDAAQIPGMAPDTDAKFYEAAIEWSVVRGNPSAPHDGETLLGLDWVRRSAAAGSGEKAADSRPWPHCGEVILDPTTIRAVCVRVNTWRESAGSDATLGYAFRLTLSDTEGANQYIFWTAPQWEQNSDLSVEDVCDQRAFADFATPGTAAVPFCDGQWALLRLSHSGEGDAPSIVVRRSETDTWVRYTSFPTAICVDQFRAEGGPKDLQPSFPPCQ